MNTDEYEGHTPGPWVYNRLNSKGQYNLIAPDDWAIDMMAYDCITAEDKGMKEQDMSLIAAAPNLLAEVKRLRNTLESVLDTHPQGDCWCIEGDNGHRCMGCWARAQLNPCEMKFPDECSEINCLGTVVCGSCEALCHDDWTIIDHGCCYDCNKMRQYGEAIE